MAQNDTTEITVTVGPWYWWGTGRFASKKRDYTVRHADGRIHIQVQSKAEVKTQVRKAFGPQARPVYVEVQS